MIRLEFMLVHWQLSMGNCQLKEAVMFKKILVPLDGSQLATNALSPALALAKSADGLVLLLRVPVYQKQTLPAQVTAVYNRLRPPEEKEWVQQRVERYLRSVRQMALGQEIEFETLVIDGDPAGVIVDTAESQDVDLIIMSTHGRGGLVRWWLGSVTEKVLRATARPILIVSSDELPTRTLVTLDGSTAAEAALEPARYLAGTLGTPLYLLRVLEPLEMAEDDPDISSKEAADLNNQVEAARQEEAVAYLAAIKERLAEGEVAVETAVVAGPPAPAILDYIEKQQIDLVVMSSHGQSAEARWAYGSVTEKVIHAAERAVLVVRPSTPAAN
jgi:nucleotide-binding universal stress UspA family protein